MVGPGMISCGIVERSGTIGTTADPCARLVRGMGMALRAECARGEGRS